MNADPQQAKALFLQAVEKYPPDQWQAFLDQACAGQPELRRRVEVLLEAHGEAGTAAHQPGNEGPPPRDVGDAAEQRGSIIGPYKLLEQIGEGGMGTVWMAQQTEPVKRRVALKLIKAGMDSKQVIARFEAERQALALMEHPNIARVLDGGTTEGGRPYFVMDLVKGMPITRYCDEHHLTPRQRLELFLPVCQAVQHAHQKGIIHRDLKPTNVLVALYDGKPVPKVIDFGLAKAAGQSLTEKTLVTGFGNIVGTLEYMSPEQAEVNQLDIDTRSDIYSLGVLLYELLAGSPPFTRKELEKAGMLEMLRVIREQEPSKPSTKLSTAEGLPTLAANRGTEPTKLTKLVRGELDWIVMKALEKDRNRRFETANGFAMDVQRYLADEAVQACPPSAWYRFRKFARRNRSRLAFAAALALLLLGAVAFAWHSEWQAAQRRAEAAGRERDERARLDRNAVAVAGLLDQCEAALRADRAGQAALALGAAERRAAEGGAEGLTGRLARCRVDLGLLRELDAIDTFRWTVTEGRLPNFTAVVPQWRAALAAYGMTVEGGAVQEAAGLLNRSLVRDRVLTALDHWLATDSSAGVRAVLRVADSDPYRDPVRDAIAAGDSNTVAALAGRPEALAQPARFAVVLGQHRALPRERRRAVIQAALRGRPGDPGLLLLMAQTYPDRPQWAAQRVRWYQAAVAANPENAAAHNNLGIILDGMREFDAAIVEFQEAIRLDPKSARVHLNLGLTLVRQRKPDAAIADFQEATQLDPKSPNVCTGWGQALAAKKDFKGAIARYWEAIGIDPNFAPARTYLAKALSATGDEAGAIAQYKEAIRLDPNDAHAIASLGVILWQKGNLEGALARYEEAIRVDPTYAPAHTNRGVVLWQRGNLDQALPEFWEAIRLEPENAHANCMLGNALSEMGDLKGALVHLQKAVQLDPEDATYPCELGKVLDAKGDLDEAIEAYQAAIRIDPQHVIARNNLAFALGRQGQPDLALPLLQQLAAEMAKGGYQHKRAATIISDLINCHERLEQFDEVETWRRKWLAVVKERSGGHSAPYAAALAALGRNSLQQEKWTDAEEVLRECLAVYEQKETDSWKRSEAESMLGAALLGRERYADAEPLLLKGYEGMKERAKAMPATARARIARAADRLVRLYQTTDRKGDAAKWRAIREQHEGTRVGDVHDVGDGVNLQGKLDGKNTTLVYEVKLTAGKTYVIDMVSPDQKALDPYLVLEGPDGRHLAEDDAGGGVKVRLTHRVLHDGVYRIRATSDNAAGRGAFTLTVREKK